LAAVVFWTVYAATSLLFGARPTVRVTNVFLALEAESLAGFAVLDAARWPALHVAVHVGHVPFSGGGDRRGGRRHPGRVVDQRLYIASVGAARSGPGHEEDQRTCSAMHSPGSIGTRFPTSW